MLTGRPQAFPGGESNLYKLLTCFSVVKTYSLNFYKPAPRFTVVKKGSAIQYKHPTRFVDAKTDSPGFVQASYIICGGEN